MDYVYLILFSIGAILSILKRINFEKHKEEKSAEYISLFRENNTMMIIIFTALLIDKIIAVS